MPFKTITVTEDAYNAIKRMKRNDESFSELFNRIAPKKVTVKDMLGIWKDKSPEEIERIMTTIKENREQMNKDFELRHKKFFGDGK